MVREYFEFELIWQVGPAVECSRQRERGTGERRGRSSETFGIGSHLERPVNMEALPSRVRGRRERDDLRMRDALLG
jgi:hypothetical protein